MSDGNKNKPNPVGDPPEAGRARDAIGLWSQMGLTAAKLTEAYALEVQRQWAGATEASVRVWGYLTRGYVELAAGAAVMQLDTLQKSLDAMKRAAPNGG